MQNKISIANGNMIVSDNAKPSASQKVLMVLVGILIFCLQKPCPFKVGDVLRIQSATTFAELPVVYVQMIVNILFVETLRMLLIMPLHLPTFLFAGTHRCCP